MRGGTTRSWIAVATALACLVAVPVAADVEFGPHDVRTIFYISKSDDRNRVDYGIRLDATCRPQGGQPIYAYWHRFEPNQPTFGDLNGMDERAYGITRQHVRSATPTSTWLEMYLRGFQEQRFLILVQRDRSERCHARAMLTIDEHDSFLEHIHVTLGMIGVDRVTLHGRDAQSGAERTEVRRPPRRTLFGG